MHGFCCCFCRSESDTQDQCWPVVERRSFWGWDCSNAKSRQTGRTAGAPAQLSSAHSLRHPLASHAHRPPSCCRYCSLQHPERRSSSRICFANLAHLRLPLIHLFSSSSRCTEYIGLACLRQTTPHHTLHQRLGAFRESFTLFRNNEYAEKLLSANV